MTDQIIYDYPPPVSELLTLGNPRERLRRIDYPKMGLTNEHIPDLIRMLEDDDLHRADSEGTEVWAPLHAWRALGVLRAESAVEPLIALLSRIDEYDDDWIAEDLPDVLAQIGSTAVAPLEAFLADSQKGLWARVNAAGCLAKIGQTHPEAREACVTALTKALQNFEKQDEELNGFIISALVDLKAVESAAMMEQAFAAKKADESILGDWEDIQIALGLLDKRITPQPHYTWMPEAEAVRLDRLEAQHKSERQSHRQAKAKTRTKNKQARKQRKKQRKKKKKR